MTVIGLTGPTGAGKTMLCTIASRLGIKSINADEVYHDLLIPPSRCLDEIVIAFGKDILKDDGTLDRGKLGKIVFSDSKKLTKLNEITHKYVKSRFREIIAKFRFENETAVIVDAPTLFESGFDKECDLTVCLLASEEARRRRIISRDDLSDERANARINAQKSDSFFTDRSDHVIINNGSEAELENSLNALLKKLKILQ